MNHAIRRLLFALVPLVPGVVLCAETPKVNTTLPGKPPVVLTMYADEPVMHRAIRRARAELPEFLELAESPNRHLVHFAVRVALRQGPVAEYIWVTDFSKNDAELYAGVVDGDIHMPTQFKRGDRFTFVRGDIIDWTYTDERKGRVHGAYTECALLTLAPPEVAAKIRKDHKLDCEF